MQTLSRSKWIGGRCQSQSEPCVAYCVDGDAVPRKFHVNHHVCGSPCPSFHQLGRRHMIRNAPVRVRYRLVIVLLMSSPTEPTRSFRGHRHRGIFAIFSFI